MIKLYLKSLKKDFILSWKIISVISIFLLISFLTQIFIEHDTSITSLIKGIILSLLIFNTVLIIFAFKCEDNQNFTYLSHLFDLNEKQRIITRYLFFFIINSGLLLTYLIFNINFLLLGFFVNIIISSLMLLVYYLLGSTYIVTIILIVSALTIFFTRIIAIDLSFNNSFIIFMLIIGILIYLVSLLISLTFSNLKRKVYD